MRNVKEELKNRVNKHPVDERTVATLVTELQRLDEQIGKSICDCLNAKQIALRGKNDELKTYIDYATQRLQESMEMTIMFRVVLGKVLKGIIEIDRRSVEEGNRPLAPILFEGHVELG